MIGTLTWPTPRLEAIATGASICAASNTGLHRLGSAAEVHAGEHIQASGQ
jgi:hypothetical protein